MERSGTNAFEIVVLTIAAAAAAAIGIVWSGATLALLAAGHPRALPIDAAAHAARHLPSSGGEPAAAWPAPFAELLPGPVLYWACTAIVAAGIALAAAAAYRKWGGNRVGTTRRRPLGVDARAGFATASDLAPLTVPGPIRGRFILGRAGRRQLLATEDAGTTHGSRRRSRSRSGDRGAVALVGPSRCGKTTAAIGGILEWEGPAVLSSVKADLLAATRGWRSHEGTVQVFDPTSTVGRRGTSASWSPVAQSSTTPGAQRAARALCDAAPKGGVEGGMDFWLAQAEILLSALLFVANRTNRDMGALAAWVLGQDRPTDLGPGEVRTALDALLCDPDDTVVTAAADAARSLMGVWDMEERTRSSVYATAQTVVWPWADPGVAASSRGRSIDLPWLLSGRNTVYLCSPIEDQRRLAPAFGGLLNDLINQAYRHVASTGKPIDPPLLIVVDEAGNTPLRSLPEYASTLAGLGVLLVTIWQSIAQLEAAYGRAADTILTNHLSKVFYSGLSDPATLRYLGTVLGDAEVETRSRSASGGPGPTASQWATTRNPLAPVHALRQMQPGDALLLHGTLPPAHIRTRPFYRDRHLAERASHPVLEQPVAAVCSRSCGAPIELSWRQSAGSPSLQASGAASPSTSSTTPIATTACSPAPPCPSTCGRDSPAPATGASPATTARGRSCGSAIVPTPPAPPSAGSTTRPQRAPPATRRPASHDRPLARPQGHAPPHEGGVARDESSLPAPRPARDTALAVRRGGSRTRQRRSVEGADLGGTRR